MKKYIYAGTYTSGLSKGIYRFTFEEGRLSDPALFCEIENPKYLCRYEDKIVAVNDFTEGAGLSLIDENGQIIDSLIYEKATSCYVTSEEGNIYSANYHEGTFSKIDLNKKPWKAETVLIQDKGGCHQVLCHDHKIYVPCLFLDKVMVYDEKLNQTGKISFPKGSGPRHGAFSEDGKYLYLVSELSNELFVIDVKEEKILSRTSVFEDRAVNLKGSAALRFDPDKKRLYISNRVRNVLSVFEVNGKDVRLLQNAGCEGDHPRDFILVDDFLLCANRFSNEVVCFALKENGLIGDPVDRICIPEAVSLLQ